MEKQTVGEIAVKEELLTYLWVGMEDLAAILLFDGFSERKRKPSVHWTVAACFIVLNAATLNLMDQGVSSMIRVLCAEATFFALHVILYRSSRVFSLYIAVICYALMCNIDNFCITVVLLLFGGAPDAISAEEDIPLSLLIHGVVIGVFCLLRYMRGGKIRGTTGWKWYTAPALLSQISIALIFFFATCFLKGQMSVLPLFVCAAFIVFLEMAALLLISWMERNARLREQTLSLQTKAKAQQESIEALSAAYARQRKLTHDFQAHLDALAGLLAQKSPDTDAAQKYIDSLRAQQTSRILLVDTHHSALDALLNQKAFVARDQKTDIQFAVNDLSAVKINMADLTVLISNTLDNAIEACGRLPDSDRQIFVKVLLEDDVLFYAVRNRSLPVDVQPGSLPSTTKADPSFHGYGLQNVESTLKKYHSLYAMGYADGWFDFATDLPNTPLP